MKEFSLSQQYEIPTVTNDLRHEELIHQIADSLDHLHTVITDVFSKVEKRISTNRARLTALNDRARLAQAKIDHLATTGKKKATQVFSSSKYPAADGHSSYSSIFEAEESFPDQKRRSKLKNRYHQPLSDKDLKDKLVHSTLEIADKEHPVEVSGLGSLPSNIDSISSLLLFNTSENLYKNYVLIDPRGVVTRTKVIEEDETLGRPDEAPSTITQREELDHANKENFNYNPNLGNVPDFSVPADLPDLADIADDIRFDNDANAIQSIAPSVFAHIPDLPDIQPETTSSEPPPPPPAAGAPPPPPPPASSAAPPAPPPPPAGAPPPPAPPPPGPAPPPPPPHTIKDDPPTEAPSSKPDVVPDAVGGDGRSNLMDAIRKAGGAGKAKLKSAVRRVHDEKQADNKKKKEAKAPASGGDLFADLALRLAGRRKGITGSGGGNKAAEEEIPKPPAPVVEAPSGAMSKMSDMIAYNPVAQTHDDDADWASD